MEFNKAIDEIEIGECVEKILQTRKKYSEFSPDFADDIWDMFEFLAEKIDEKKDKNEKK